jgi:cardiolipin synthase
MSDTNWKFYLRSGDAWDAMYTDCEAAQKSIDMEQFIFSNDAVGTRFSELLKRKSSEGVAVRLICDAVGSFDLLNTKTSRSLLEKGIKIIFFNPINPWRLGNFFSWFLRDHRKLLVIDKSIAHIGGVGIEDRMVNWRDTNVRLTGPVVSEAQAGFDRMWSATSRHKFSRVRPLFKEGEDFSYLTNSPRYHGRYVYHDLRKTIRKAKKYIHLTTPYFVPSIIIFAALINAARRGVDVRIVLPGSSDVQIANIATGSYILLALNAGIKIYFYDNKRILHAKAGVIDGIWGTVGSSNIDNLSLLLNFEGNIKSIDPSFITELEKQFMDDLSASKMITKEEWVRRPLFLKFLELMSWPVHGIL